MTRYYITDPNNKDQGLIEVTEKDFIKFMGTEETRLYASQVYRKEISMEDVPTELQEQVQTVLDYKIAHCGEYDEQIISAEELKEMLEGLI